MMWKLVLGRALNVRKCREEHIAVEGRACGNKTSEGICFKIFLKPQSIDRKIILNCMLEADMRFVF
jgi:hypothetical protein